MTRKITIPIFPLSGVIFFPKTNLPLNIFEDKYLEMVDFALSSNKMIGMIQPLNNNQLYNIGCVGKITNFNETNDNRYIINLYGINCFKIIKERSLNKKFRVFETSIYDNEKTQNFITNKNLNRKKLVEMFVAFLNRNNSEIDIKYINKINSEELLKLMAMLCPFSITEKQMLLETMNLEDLSDKLIALFEFYNNEYSYQKTIN